MKGLLVFFSVGYSMVLDLVWAERDVVSESKAWEDCR